MNGTDEFTYFGDLVGVTSLYNGDPENAYNVLHEFYNTVFHGLKPYDTAREHRQVLMFSDSLMVTGDTPEEFIKTMAPVYWTLLTKGIFLRGGIVAGRLRKDARLERNTFEKFLPDSDVLARTTMLEKRGKGARFFISSAIAKRVIQPKDAWLVLTQYDRDPAAGDQNFDLQRSIAPIDDGSCYEVLYPLLSGLEDADFDRRAESLRFLSASVSPDISKHYDATLRLFEASRLRWQHRNSISHA